MIIRGGIAVVWLGKRDDKYFAMKQFPIKANKQVDTSAQIEFQMQSLIKRHSTKEGIKPQTHS